MPPSTEQSAPRTMHFPPSQYHQQSTKVLACVLCQQRKVKCDRMFPCANCVRHEAQCVPATLARRRRRRFPEGDLLERLRKYEDLLRQNKVKFDPLHGDGPIDTNDESEEESASSVSVKTEGAYATRSIWKAMSQESSNASTASPIACALESSVKESWDKLCDDDAILLGSHKAKVDLSTFHPGPVDIFRLWQIYLFNVDPMFKITHTPSLQGRIVEAASNVKNITHSLEALMFSIYCVSIHTIGEDECLAMFGQPKKDLATKYGFGCQQALINAGYLRSSDRECLVAFFLYLLSVPPGTNPRFLSSMLGTAMRMAQCMGINREATLARHSAFEAEMRRRLWWALVLYDSRMSEKADLKDSALSPTWDCKVPLNVNDSSLRPEMKEPPTSEGTATEALFIVVSSELADFVRHAPFHLDFTNPALKPIAKVLPNAGSLDALENRIQKTFFHSCDVENPLHSMTMWVARVVIAKCRLLEYYATCTEADDIQTDAQRDAAMTLALKMLEGETELMGSSLTKHCRWHLKSYFPFTAYMHVLHDLTYRPLNKQAAQAWDILSTCYAARSPPPGPVANALLVMFTKIVMSAWEALERVCQGGEALVEPMIVSSLKEREMTRLQTTRDVEDVNGIQQPAGFVDINFVRPMPARFSREGFLDVGALYTFGDAGPTAFPPGSTTDDSLGFDASQFVWPPMGWNLE